MKFSDIIDQASALLQRKGRITNGALKREFDLDDAAFEDLKACRSEFLALLAEAYGEGRTSRGGAQDGDGEALAFVEKTEERFCEAELRRLQGELLLQQSPDNATEAEACFQKALDLAQHQQAKSWELLAPVYDWFTEGFDTADLKDAKALLDELAEGG